MKKMNLVFNLLMIVPLLSNAQINSKKGYVVNLEKDTLKGYISIKDYGVNPRSVEFKVNINSNPIIYNLENCSGFGIDGLSSFQKYKVKISLGTDDFAKVSNLPDTSSIVEEVFLKKILDGKHINLYSYNDKIKERFYIQNGHLETPVELIKRTYRHPDNWAMQVVDSYYLNQIKSDAQKYLSFEQITALKIDETKYNEVELIKTVSLINGQRNNNKKIKPFRFFAGLGLNASKGYYKGDTDLANSVASVKTSYLPMVTAGIDLFSNPATQKLIYRAELSLLTSKYEISTTTTEAYRSALSHSFNQFTIALTPQILYNFYNETDFKFFLTAGAMLNFSSYSKNESKITNSFRQETTIQQDAVKLGQFNFAPQIGAGLQLKKNIELSLGYSFPSVVSSFAAYNLYIKRYRIGINYVFSK